MIDFQYIVNKDRDPSRRELWGNHRIGVKGLFEEIHSVEGKVNRIGIIGAGNCDDLDLEYISTICNEIHLFDVDVTSMEQATQNLSKDIVEKLRLVQIDITTIDTFVPEVPGYLYALFDYGLTIEALAETNRWVVIEGTTSIPTFYSRTEDKSSFVDLIKVNKGFQAFKERTKSKVLEIGGAPIINLAQGSMALLLASGAVNGTIGQGDTLHAVQGMEVVTKVVSEEETENTLITKTRTKREVSVKVITPSGIVKKFM
ncbi:MULTISPECIES: hypothetical protein [unclassified Lysinibacillus]|uniref:hypothetical protein n=1 Tax=unclassified Lysinibacillus TaxID=2636778 RepID=UPI0037FCEBF6